MKRTLVFLALLNLLSIALYAQPLSSDPALAKFKPLKAPEPSKLLLKKGDRLAICGDSITEQKMYSRIMETYLTACVPELEVTARQYGWGGEKADGFLARMTNDCLRFKPTIATTCYGMNDHGYRPYEASIGDRYRKYETAIVEAFKANGVRVVLGSPGCVGKRPNWSKDTNATTEALNLNLCELRNIDIGIAKEENVGFADVFWPMLVAGNMAQQKYSTNYAIAGKDGVHPGWAGHLVMAYAFLKGLGLNGDLGTFTVDLKGNKAKASKGHEVVSAKPGEFEIKSSRYPFCAKGETDSDNSIRSAMTLVPFNKELNRLVLIAKGGNAPKYKVAWGSESHTYSADQLAKGVNLAEDFVENPFSEAFDKVDKAVAAKQSYETKQIKQSFRSPEAKQDMNAVVEKTEAERSKLADAIKSAFVPVTHTLRITPES